MEGENGELLKFGEGVFVEDPIVTESTR